jgi:translation initiation factor 1 (eIF-1/SUI1)
MSSSSREELMEVLLGAGMDPGEADNFLRQGNTIVNKVIQLDGRTVARVLPELAKMGLMSGAVNVRIGIEKSREEAFVGLVEGLTSQKIIRMTDFSGETAKRTDPLDLGDLDDPKQVTH